MSEIFDPNTHMFGMAYRLPNNQIHNLFGKCIGGFHTICCGGHSFVWTEHLDRLTRAPEFDLLTAIQFKKANIDALNWLRAHLRIADLHTHPEFKTIERLLGGESK